MIFLKKINVLDEKWKAVLFFHAMIPMIRNALPIYEFTYGKKIYIHFHATMTGTM